MGERERGGRVSEQEGERNEGRETMIGGERGKGERGRDWGGHTELGRRNLCKREEGKGERWKEKRERDVGETGEKERGRRRVREK